MSFQLFTNIGAVGTVRSAASMDTAIFFETSPGGSVGPTGVHFNSTVIEPINKPLGVQVIDAPTRMYNSAATKQKVFATFPFTGAINPNELVYLLASTRGRVTPTTPSHSGRYTINLNGGVNPFTLNLNGMGATANIAAAASANAVRDAMIAKFGRGCARVTQEDVGVFIVDLQGEYALGSGLTMATTNVGAVCITTPTGGAGVYRYTYDLGTIDVANILTMRLLQGPFNIPLQARRSDRAGFSGVGMEIGLQGATVSGNGYSLPPQRDFTIDASAITDIPQVNAVPDQWNYYYGSTKTGATGPAQLCNGTRMAFNLDGLVQPYMVIGCNHPSMKGVTAAKPSTSFEMTVLQDADADTMLSVIEQGESQYAIAEYLGPDIAPGIPYRIVVMMPHIIESADNGTEGNNASYQLSGQVATKDTLTPKIVIDCGIPSV